MLHAQQEPIKRTVLVKSDLEGIEGKEAILFLAELAPGAVGGKHYHSGTELFYAVEGAFTHEPEGKPPVTLRQGQAGHQSPQGRALHQKRQHDRAGTDSRLLDRRQGPADDRAGAVAGAGKFNSGGWELLDPRRLTLSECRRTSAFSGAVNTVASLCSSQAGYLESLNVRFEED